MHRFTYLDKRSSPSGDLHEVGMGGRHCTSGRIVVGGEEQWSDRIETDVEYRVGGVGRVNHVA